MPLFNWVPPTFAKSKFPAGIILPMLGGSVPDKWSSFTAADGKFIVGAGSTYSVGSSGGSASVSLSGTVGSDGSHSGNNSLNVKSGGGNNGATVGYGGATRSHNHTVSDSATIEDKNRTYILIKSDIGVDTLPPQIGAFGHVSLKSPLSNVHGAVDRFIKADTVDGTLAGSDTPTSSGFTTSNDGDHNHHTNSGQCSADDKGGCSQYTNSGGHTHTGSFNTTLDTKYFYLSLWNHATAGCGHQKNMIAMWEGATAPAGWRLCDGTNGAPDIRDFFIRIGSTSQHGNFGGSNSSIWNITGLSSAGAHTHPYSSDNDELGTLIQNGYHSGTYGAHSSHVLALVEEYLPPYYALSFIIKD